MVARQIFLIPEYIRYATCSQILPSQALSFTLNGEEEIGHSVFYSRVKTNTHEQQQNSQ